MLLVQAHGLRPSDPYTHKKKPAKTVTEETIIIIMLMMMIIIDFAITYF